MTTLNVLLARVQEAKGEIAKSHPSLVRGQVWCRSCGFTQQVDSAACLRSGWPKCCGYTMTIDSPDEQATLLAQQEAASLDKGVQP